MLFPRNGYTIASPSTRLGITHELHRGSGWFGNHCKLSCLFALLYILASGEATKPSPNITLGSLSLSRSDEGRPCDITYTYTSMAAQCVLTPLRDQHVIIVLSFTSLSAPYVPHYCALCIGWLIHTSNVHANIYVLVLSVQTQWYLHSLQYKGYGIYIVYSTTSLAFAQLAVCHGVFILGSTTSICMCIVVFA